MNASGKEGTVDPDLGGEVGRDLGDGPDHEGGRIQEAEDIGREVIPEVEGHAVDLDEGQGRDHVVQERKNPSKSGMSLSFENW